MANMFDVLNMTHHKFDTMCKRLDAASGRVTNRFGRHSGDPVDIVVAAYEDSFICAHVRRDLEQSGVTYERALAEAERTEDRPDFEGHKGSDGIQPQSFKPEMREVLVRLAEDYEAHKALSPAAQRQDPWDWTRRLVRYALAAVEYRSS